jgi:hypothetical protein
MGSLQFAGSSLIKTLTRELFFYFAIGRDLLFAFLFMMVKGFGYAPSGYQRGNFNGGPKKALWMRGKFTLYCGMAIPSLQNFQMIGKKYAGLKF